MDLKLLSSFYFHWRGAYLRSTKLQDNKIDGTKIIGNLAFNRDRYFMRRAMNKWKDRTSAVDYT